MVTDATETVNGISLARRVVLVESQPRVLEHTSILVLEEQIPGIVEATGDIAHDGADTRGIRSRREKETGSAPSQSAIDRVRFSRMARGNEEANKERNPSFSREKLVSCGRGGGVEAWAWDRGSRRFEGGGGLLGRTVELPLSLGLTQPALSHFHSPRMYMLRDYVCWLFKSRGGAEQPLCFSLHAPLRKAPAFSHTTV